MFEWDEWIWDLVRDVVEANHIQSLEWIGSNLQLEPVADDEAEEGIMSVAALNGNIEIVRWLSSKNIVVYVLNPLLMGVIQKFYSMFTNQVVHGQKKFVSWQRKMAT